MGLNLQTSREASAPSLIQTDSGTISPDRAACLLWSGHSSPPGLDLVALPPGGYRPDAVAAVVSSPRDSAQHLPPTEQAPPPHGLLVYNEVFLFLSPDTLTRSFKQL